MSKNCNYYELNSISKLYLDNHNKPVHALKDITLKLPIQGFIGITGKSGSGKSTLLNLLGLIEKPTTGTIKYNNLELDFNDQKNIGKLRSTKIGFVFQDYNLLYDISVKENLSVGVNVTDSEILKVLKIVHIDHIINSPVRYLSGGEKQRLAIARVLIRNSEVLLLDEPTGNLDAHNSDIIFNLLKSISKNRLVVLVSHDASRLSQYADEMIYLDQGEVKKIVKSEPFNEFQIECVDNLSVSVDKLYRQPTKFSDIKAIHIKNMLNGKFDILDSKDDLLSEYIDIIKNKGESSLIVKVMRDQDISNEKYIINDEVIYNEKLSFVFKTKYALNMFVKKRFLSFLTIVSLLITFLLVIFQVSMTYISPEYILGNAITIEKNSVLPIRKSLENEHTLVTSYYTGGRFLYDYYQEKIGENRIYSFLDLSIAPRSNQVDITQYTNRIELNTVINYQPSSNLLINEEIIGFLPNEEKTIVITDFMAKYIFGHTDVLGYSLFLYSNQSIYQSDLNNERYLIISGIIKTDFETENIFHEITNNLNYYYENYDVIKYKYAVAYMTQESYESYFKSAPIFLKAADFTLSSQNTSTYVNQSQEVPYRVYNEDLLLMGKKPENSYEVVVSSDFFATRDIIFNQNDLNTIYYYKDLMNTMNWSYYQDIFNIFEVIEHVKIVGIAQSTSNTVFIHQTLHEEIVKKYITYATQIGISINDETKIHTIKTLYEDNSIIHLDYLTPIYAYVSLVNSSISEILSILLVLFVIIASILTLTQGLISIHEKTKEIGIMKSLGIKISQILTIFIVQNSIPVFIALILASLTSFLWSNFTNDVLNSTDLFNTPYQLYYINSYSFIVIIIISILMITSSIVIPSFRIRKIDVSILIED
jgi:ABC-type lipoprotein export system ATPase subunit/ABC-type antimicrobial peptide transport system permease subunit